MPCNLGEPLAISSTRFDALVIDYKAFSSNDDGIFEPNERISLSQLVFKNDGGLALPSGAHALFPSTKTVNFEPTRYTIPEVSHSMFYEIVENENVVLCCVHSEI